MQVSAAHRLRKGFLKISLSVLTFPDLSVARLCHDVFVYSQLHCSMHPISSFRATDAYHYTTAFPFPLRCNLSTDNFLHSIQGLCPANLRRPNQLICLHSAMQTTANHEPHSRHVPIKKLKVDCNYSSMLMMTYISGWKLQRVQYSEMKYRRVVDITILGAYVIAISE